MARPDSLGATVAPEDEMMMEDDGMGGEMDALVSDVIAAAMPGIEGAIRDALSQILGGGMPAEGIGGEEAMM